jgi:hypothetical protein
MHVNHFPGGKFLDLLTANRSVHVAVLLRIPLSPQITCKPQGPILENYALQLKYEVKGARKWFVHYFKCQACIISMETQRVTFGLERKFQSHCPWQSIINYIGAYLILHNKLGAQNATQPPCNGY